MKNNYNPYTVPEHYFEETQNRAVTAYRRRKRSMRYGVAAMVVAAALIVTPLFIHTHESDVQEKEALSTNLAGLYEYDIFLQVNFTE